MEAIVTSEGGDTITHSQLITETGAPVSIVQVSLPPAGQQIQVASIDPESAGSSAEDDDSSRRRREILARRPSYRKIFNELSGETATNITLTKIEEESNSSDEEGGGHATASGVAGIHYQQAVVPGQTIQIAAHDGAAQGLQTLTMTNANNNAPTTGATIVQYAQGPDGQFLIPGNMSTISAGGVQYQITPSGGAISQGVVMANAAGATIATAGHTGEETSRKRELRLLKNREAARECRRKKKEYVKCLENRVAVLENQNKTLIEELKSLKELYCQKEAQS